MKIVITGGTGFIGRALVERLSRAGHSGWIVSRSSAKAPGTAPNGAGSFRVVGWDRLEEDPSELAGVEAIVNLAGSRSASAGRIAPRSGYGNRGSRRRPSWARCWNGPRRIRRCSCRRPE